MKKKRFTEEQIVGMLRQAEQSGQTVCHSPRGLIVKAMLKNARPVFIFFGLHQKLGY